MNVNLKIAFDINGTLVNQNKELEMYTRFLMKVLHTLGIEIHIATGHSAEEAKEILQQHNLGLYTIHYQSSYKK